MNGHETRQQRDYATLVDRMSPGTSMTGGLLRAFTVGGLICCAGQLINDGLTAWFSMSKEDASGFTSILLILIAALLTGIGVYDKLGKFAGAGSIVPITGFSNSIVAPAMEFKREGIVLGIGAKLFTLAGPVLVNGISVSILVGLIYYFFKI